MVGEAASNFSGEPLLPFLVSELIFQFFDPTANGFRFGNLLLLAVLCQNGFTFCVQSDMRSNSLGIIYLMTHFLFWANLPPHLLEPKYILYLWSHKVKIKAKNLLCIY